MLNFVRCVTRVSGLIVLLFSLSGPVFGQGVSQFAYERLDVVEGTGSTATDLVDLDNDGDLDYLTSNKSTNESFWYENRGEEGWARHFMGKSSVYDGGPPGTSAETAGWTIPSDRPSCSTLAIRGCTPISVK